MPFYQELVECRRKLEIAQETKDQLVTQLSDGVAFLSNQLKELKETHQAALKARDERVRTFLHSDNAISYTIGALNA